MELCNCIHCIKLGPGPVSEAEQTRRRERFLAQMRADEAVYGGPSCAKCGLPADRLFASWQTTGQPFCRRCFEAVGGVFREHVEGA